MDDAAAGIGFLMFPMMYDQMKHKRQERIVAICPHCGAISDHPCKFCRECGKSAAVFRTCPYCGETLNLPKPPRYCPYCSESFCPE